MKKREIEVQTIVDTHLDDQLNVHCENCQKLTKISVATLKKIYGDKLEIPEQPHQLRCSHCGNYESCVGKLVTAI